ncbi:polyribonucleotide nucleotidyltransferase [Patescibacteria group bacterium]|nr:polyribonucleotide nucleotidyltransferase [Patescibacteria group bacterium]
MSKIERFEIEWGGKPLIIETERFHTQANGTCTVQYGETVILATASMSNHKREGIDFFPLMVEYEEKLYAAGRIKGSRFMKKEGRPTDEAILVGRSIDRGLRPLFDQEMRNEVQVVITVLAFDGENDPDILGVIGASCALHMSDIPWAGPVGAVRVGQIDGEWVLNPSYEARNKSILDLAFTGNTDTIIMVEAGANECPDDTVVEAFEFGRKHLKPVIKLIEDVRAKLGQEKVDVMSPTTETEIAQKEGRERAMELAAPFVAAKTKEYFFAEPKANKKERRAAMDRVGDELKAHLTEKEIEEEFIGFALGKVYELIEAEVSRAIIEEGKRVDGRKMDEIRQIVVETGLLPRVHGSGQFKRGETQVLSIVTLGSPGDELTLDGMETMGTRRYFHHYNFPPFSVGDVKPMRGPGRRDIGHGALAEKALDPMIPNKEDFPYTVRVMSEVMSSNGSSSMASTCGSTIALMDAGVPIKKPVAGIAMGLAADGKGKFQVLTDLQDLEDGPGGMDFKITGTRDGITAVQMDTKTHGLTHDIVVATFKQAKGARMQLIDDIQAVIKEPRKEMSPHAPRIISIKIHPDQIRDVIGPGGKMINEIIDVTGVQSIDIEDDGLVMITSVGAEAADKAVKWVKDLTRKVEAGEIFKGKVVRLMDFGAFEEVLPKQDGLVHISELAPWRVDKVEDIVKEGDEVFVKVLEIDNMGRVNLSMKQAPGNVYPERKASSGRPGGDKPFKKRD